MGIVVQWTREDSGHYIVAADSAGVSIWIRTTNLGYASKLTSLILDSTPAAFDPPPAPELLPEIEAQAYADPDDAVPVPTPHDEAMTKANGMEHAP